MRDAEKLDCLAVCVAVTASGTVGPTIVEPSLDDCCVTGDAIVDRIEGFIIRLIG